MQFYMLWLEAALYFSLMCVCGGCVCRGVCVRGGVLLQ